MRVPLTEKLLAEIRRNVIPAAQREYRTVGAGVTTDYGEVLLGEDGNGFVHLLLPMPPGVVIKEDRNSEGVRLVSHSLVDHAGTRAFADLECTKPHLLNTFHSLTEELLETLRAERCRPDEAAHSVLNRWRELLDRAPRPPLGRNSLAGLLAELRVLREVLNGLSTRLACWTGPRKQRHDFSAGNTAIEVKACLSTQRRVIRVNGLTQLEPPPGGQLFVRVVSLEEVQGAESVPALIDEIVKDGVERRELLLLLSEVGYESAHEQDYRRVMFRTLEESTYRIEHGFPRLTPTSFAGGGPPVGVSDVTYSIDLGSATAFKVDEMGWNEALSRLRIDADGS